jgi:hypothetical protein
MELLANAYTAAVASAAGDDIKIGGSTSTKVNDFVNRGAELDDLYEGASFYTPSQALVQPKRTLLETKRTLVRCAYSSAAQQRATGRLGGGQALRSRTQTAQAEGLRYEVGRRRELEHVVLDRRQKKTLNQSLGAQVVWDRDGGQDTEELLAAMLGEGLLKPSQVFEDLVDARRCRSHSRCH